MNAVLSNILRGLTLLLILNSAVVLAGMYKWVDEQGKTHYGDSVPPQYSKQQRKSINDQGRTVKVYEAAKTPEERAEFRRLEAIRLAKETKRKEREHQDRILLATYSSEDDLLAARDGKLSSLDSLMQLTTRRIQSLQTRLERLAEDAAEYERSGKALPKTLTHQIDTVRNQIQDNESFMLEKQREYDEITLRFEIDLTRLRELKQAAEESKQAIK
ncbi:MAG: DUF4124 domain-containing protein [Gammaproteobacteria bacterium]